MVQEQNGAPTIKVLDFGLARITDENQTYVTEIGIARGTLPYMSPEQVRGSTDEVDLRTDVYALGVILYQALSGRLPHDISKVSIPQAARVICENPPLRLEEAVRPGRIDEDLCTIVHKALDQDPARRYAGVAALADDIQRYLTDQPIQGRPPSTVYQIRKLVARHRLPFGFAAALLLLLIASIVAVSFQARRIARERDRANREAETARQVSAFLTRLFSISNPNASRGNAVTARELLEQGSARIATELKDQPAVRASLLASMGSAYDGLGLYPQARKLSSEALDLRRQVFGPRSLEVASSLHELGSTAYNQGELPAAADYDRQALDLYRALLPSTDSKVAAAMRTLGDTLAAMGEFQQAIPLLRESLQLALKREGPDGPTTVECTQRLGMAYFKARDYAAAEPLLREAIRLYELREGEKSGDLAATLNDLGNLLSMTGDLTGAQAAYARCRDTAVKIFGPDHPNIAIIDENLAVNLRRQHRYPEAEALMRASTAQFVKTLGAQHPRYSVFLEGLGDILRDKGDLAGAGKLYRQALDFDQAHAKRHLGVSYVRMGDWLARTGHPEQGEEFLRKGLAEFQKTTPAGSPEMAEYQRQLGQCLVTLHRFAEAEPVLRQSYDMFQKTLGDANSQTRESAAALAALYDAWGKPSDAAKFRNPQ
jgi:tetratricopeptide (TPR) repeat protein